MSSNWNQLKKWFRDNEMFVKTRGNERDRRPVTHLLLDGGRIHVPPERESEFLFQYANSLGHRDRLYVVETKTPVYKFMMDLDFAAHETTSEEEINGVLRVVHTTVACYFSHLSDRQRRMVVCRTSDKRISKQHPETDQSVELVKTGIHLIWPEILVDSALALVLRGGVIYRLTEEFGHRNTINPWSDVVDRCVYIGNGLRMIGSRKMSNCSACRNNEKNKATCNACNRTGKLDEGRVYMPTVVFEGTVGRALEQPSDHNGLLGVTPASNESLHSMIQELSIRTTSRDALVPKPPSWADKVPCDSIYDTSGPDARGRGQKRRRRAEQAHKAKRTEGEWETLQKNPNILGALEPGDQRHKAIAAFILKKFPKNPKVTHLHPTRTGDYYLARSSSQYCINKGSCHNNTNVYFYIDRYGVRQKCFCTCAVNRAYGPCSKYSSTSVEFTPYVQNLLWPEFKSGATLSGWSRHQARTNMDQWLEDRIRETRDECLGKKAYEKQFFKK